MSENSKLRTHPANYANQPKKWLTLLISGICLAFGTCRSYGAVIALAATLSGQTARPPTQAPNSGEATATLDNVSGAFTISGTSATASPLASVDLRGPNHPPADELGPLILSLTFSSLSSGSGAVQGSFDGSATFTAVQMSDLLAGDFFVNVQTKTNLGRGAPVGGYLVVVPEPVASGFIGLIAPLCLFMRRIKRSAA